MGTTRSWASALLLITRVFHDNQEGQERPQAQQVPGGDHHEGRPQEEPSQCEGRDGEGKVQEGSYQGCSEARCCHHKVPEGSASQEGSQGCCCQGGVDRAGLISC